MPRPREGESYDDWMSRCVPEMIEEGYTQEQAVGRCNGFWESYKEGRDFEGVIFDKGSDS